MKRKVIGLVLALFAVAGVLCIVGYYWWCSLQLERIKTDVLAQIDLIQEIVLSGGSSDNEVADRCARLTGSRVTLLRKDGTLLADSARDQMTFSSFLYDKELILARQGEIGSAILVSPITGKNTLNMAKPGVSAAGDEIIIRLAYDLSGYDRSIGLAAQLGGLIFVAGGLLAAALFLLYLWGDHPTTQALAQYVEAIDEGKPIKLREDTPGGEELRGLAASINRLLAHNEELNRATNRKYSHINTILGSMESGLLAVDNQNQVMLFNPQAEKLIPLNKQIIFDKIDLPNIGPTARQIFKSTARVLAGGKKETITLQVSEDLILEVQTSPIVNKYAPYDDFGALAMIKDVTKIKKLEALRSEFVANVSHELRTPLTLIGGFAETMRGSGELSPEERYRALEIIEIETGRLRRLISQLLSLSQIENDLMPKADQPINLLAEVDSAVAALSNLAGSKDITLETKLPDSLPAFTGNGDWVRQVLINLCENAIKYTPRGGKIQIQASADDREITVSVKDNGVGIPKKDLPRVFERFYRVDKSRNSREGGSGLGLSIVEQMVTEMGGHIRAESKEGKGSRFVITFPLPGIETKDGES